MRDVKLLRIIALVLLCLLILAMASIYYLSNRLKSLDNMPYYYKDEATLVDRSYAAFSKDEGVSEEELREETFPISLNFNDRTCIELRLRSDNIGGSSIFCYRKDNQKLIYRTRTGE
jgi:hypothetical protein